MREYLVAQLKELIKQDQIPRHHAQDVLELYDDECDDTTENTAWDKAQQDIDNIIQGEWDL
jgi:hypothetical protein